MTQQGIGQISSISMKSGLFLNTADIATALKIDYAKATTGFDFIRGRMVPVHVSTFAGLL